MFDSKIITKKFITKLLQGITYGLLSGSIGWLSSNLVEFIKDRKIWQSISLTQAISDFAVPFYGFIFITICASIILGFAISVKDISNNFLCLIYGATQFLIVYVVYFCSLLSFSLLSNENEWFDYLSKYTIAFDFYIWTPIFITFIIFAYIYPKILRRIQM